MKKIVSIVLVSLIFSINPSQAATTQEKEEFCEGFEQGFKSIKGRHASVPRCPSYIGMPKYNSSYSEMGAEEGAEKACKMYPNDNKCR